jgi:hypothetical protein
MDRLETVLGGIVTFLHTLIAVLVVLSILAVLGYFGNILAPLCFVCCCCCCCCCKERVVEDLTNFHYSSRQYCKIFRKDTTIFINETAFWVRAELRYRPTRAIFPLHEGKTFLPLCSSSFRKKFNPINSEYKFTIYANPTKPLTIFMQRTGKKTTYLITSLKTPASLKMLTEAVVTHWYLKEIYMNSQGYPNTFRHLVSNWEATAVSLPGIGRNCKHGTTEFH